jgi:hypothetical protein
MGGGAPKGRTEINRFAEVGAKVPKVAPVHKVGKKIGRHHLRMDAQIRSLIGRSRERS